LSACDATDERRSLSKMGEKSETFCRRTLVTMNEHPKLSATWPSSMRCARTSHACAP